MDRKAIHEMVLARINFDPERPALSVGTFVDAVIDVAETVADDRLRGIEDQLSELRAARTADGISRSLKDR